MEKGDKISLQFDLPVITLDGGKSYPGMVALQRGPQVLAYDKSLNKADPKTVRLPGGNVVLKTATPPLPQGWIGRQVYAALNAAGEGAEPILLVPYADASQSGGVIATWLSKKGE